MIERRSDEDILLTPATCRDPGGGHATLLARLFSEAAPDGLANEVTLEIRMGTIFATTTFVCRC